MWIMLFAIGKVVTHPRNEFKIDLGPAFADPAIIRNLLIQRHLTFYSSGACIKFSLNPIHILVFSQHPGLRGFDLTVFFFDEATGVDFRLIAHEVYA